MKPSHRGIVLSCWIAVLGVGWGATLEAQSSLQAQFVRGDTNADGNLDISDAIAALGYLFDPSVDPPSCLDAADANDDEAVDIADSVYLLAYLFGDGPTLPAPGPDCGEDPTSPADLSCNEYAPCSGVTDLELAAHLARRMGFGPTPELLVRIQTLGADAYIDEQLHPELIDESSNDLLNDALAPLDPDSSINDLIREQVLRGAYSDKQLQEALTDFWENHFSTQVSASLSFLRNVRGTNGQPVHTVLEANAIGAGWEQEENEAFRTGGVGSFLDLLTASATSKAMIIYLDTFTNRVGNPNENYARELLELHTMGVDNGYLQADIEELARCFTGWRVCKVDPADVGDPLAPCLLNEDPNGVWNFHFEPFLHDYGSKTIFAGFPHEIVIPARPVGSVDGILDGFEVLAHLATLQQTAEFVSTKLIQRFVCDDPPPALIADCLVTWLATDGDLREVMGVILDSDEFRGADHRLTKIYTPFEYVLSQVRLTGTVTPGPPLLNGIGGNQQAGLRGLNYIPFTYETPEGRSEFGFDWLGSTDLLNRILFSTLLAETVAFNLQFDPVQQQADAGVTPDDPAAVVDYWLERFYQTQFTVAERDLALEFLSTDTAGSPAPLDPLAADYEDRIRAFVGFLLSVPQAQKQ